MKKNLLLAVTASIAIYKACDLVRAFKKEGLDVKCIMTSNAKQFISPILLEVLSNNKVVDDMFARPENLTPVHTSLAEWADLILIAPASCSIIGKLASGICDDIVTCTVFASKTNILIAPAMNDNMYKHPILRGNITRLKKLGYKFIGPKKGSLVCGYDAVGHLADIKEITQSVKRILK